MGRRNPRAARRVVAPYRRDGGPQERAATWGRPYGGNRAGSVGSEKLGAVLKPQQFRILQTQGPVARREFRHPLRFCAPEILQDLTSTRSP